jgi:mono/diheme cytochrome c family protein
LIQRLFIVFILGGGLILAVACQSSANGISPPATMQPEPILPGMPSISELAGTPTPEVPPLPILDADEIALGRRVYTDNCAECHGENLEGESDWKKQNEDNSFRSPPHDASGHTWHHGDDVLIESIELGGARLPDNIGGFSKMPAFEGVLTDEEIAAVLTYIKSTWPDDTRNIQWEQTIREQVQ